jgi:hypothetical protein
MKKSKNIPNTVTTQTGLTGILVLTIRYTYGIPSAIALPSFMV